MCGIGPTEETQSTSTTKRKAAPVSLYPPQIATTLKPGIDSVSPR